MLLKLCFKIHKTKWEKRNKHTYTSNSTQKNRFKRPQHNFNSYDQNSNTRNKSYYWKCRRCLVLNNCWRWSCCSTGILVNLYSSGQSEIIWRLFFFEIMVAYRSECNDIFGTISSTSVERNRGHAVLTVHTIVTQFTERLLRKIRHVTRAIKRKRPQKFNLKFS